MLTKAIGNGGASISDYRRPGGEQGSQQYAFYVAHRGGQTCKVCATPIERIPVRNRGTYFCPKCQKDDAEPARDASQTSSPALSRLPKTTTCS